MGVRFAIGGWAALAPGLHAPSDWLAWTSAPSLPQGPLEAKLDSMPAMQRRRLSGLGRAAAQVAWDCDAGDAGMPVVFASALGDAERCLRTLKEFAMAGTASPTEFTFSVHNAIGAMYSISRSGTGNYTSISAGRGTAAAGVVEACSLLADGAREVLLVFYQGPLPGEYAVFEDEPACTCAWAWRVVAAEQGAPHLSLTWSAGQEPSAAAAPRLPTGLEVLRFAISDAPELQQHAADRHWTWSRHA
jgi:hypothetical protein